MRESDARKKRERATKATVQLQSYLVELECCRLRCFIRWTLLRKKEEKERKKRGKRGNFERVAGGRMGKTFSIHTEADANRVVVRFDRSASNW